MILRFLGAASEVGRSCILLESKGTKIMLDCGVKLGSNTEHPQIEPNELRDIDGVVLSHAHLDHCGYLPHIYSRGWEGNTYAMKPTNELSNVLISDYIRISNPTQVTKDGLEKMAKHTKSVEYFKEFKIKDLTIKLVPAGHILGSAMIHVSDATSQSVLYTGDVNVRETKLLDAAYTENLAATTLITESTYGADCDSFQPEKITAGEMARSIKETVDVGGKVIIPSFAVGRAQEVLLLLDDYMRTGVMPKVPIYMDGMINKAMRIHRHNVIYCRDELQKRILMSEDDPFKSANFFPVTTKQMRNKIISGDEPSIIVTTSGMLTGGPVIQYISRLGKDDKNKMLFVGYQAQGTLGRQMEEGSKEIEIDHKKISVNMKIEKYHLSAHADRPQLNKLISKVRDLHSIFIVHGEERKSKELHESVKDEYDSHVPKLGEKFTL